MIKSNILSVLFLVLLLILAGCDQGEQEEAEDNGNGDDEEEQLEEEIREDLVEIEENIIDIMGQAELVPALIALSDKEVEEAEGQQQQEEEDAGNNNGNDNEEGGEEEEEALDEAAPDPDVTVTFEATVMGEVLDREKEALLEEEENEEDDDLPKSTGEAWNNMKNTVAELHQQWDAIRPLLIEEDSDPETVDSFNEDLDELTTASVEENYYGVLYYANQLTDYYAEFMADYTDNSTGAAYELKYHTRGIVLSAVDGNIEDSLMRLERMEKLLEGLEDDIEENNSEDILKELEASLEDLERVLQKDDLELIKIKAAEVMENVVAVIEEIEPEFGEE